MHKVKYSFNFLLVLIALVSCASLAQAQATRTWVSGTGDDSNPCSRTAPCRTFAGALPKTAVGGEIDALDPGSYGTFLIQKSITIDGGEGQVAGVTVSSGTGISVAAGAADTVIIRNLTINGLDQGSRGVSYTGGGLLVLDHMTIDRIAGPAFYIKGSSASTPLQAELNHVNMNSNNTGIQAEDHSFTALRDSVITGNYHRGILSFGVNLAPANGTSASIKLENNEISYTQSAIRLVGTQFGGGTSTAWLRNNHLYRNFYGLNATNDVHYHSAGGNIISETMPGGLTIAGSATNDGTQSF